MVPKKPLSWFITDKGRKFSFAVITGSSLALTTAKFSPHTFFIEKYKDLVRYYSNGQPVDLPKELQDRYQECINILNVSDIHKKYMSPFRVCGYDLFHAGCSSSKFGMAVGIPIHFTYKTLEDIDKDDIRIKEKKIDWESEHGKKLANALVLPDNVQKFALCREILMSKNNKVIYESTYPFICIFFAYNVSCYLNTRLNLYKGPTALRGIMYSIVGLFSMGMYFLMKDMTEVSYETDVDKKLVELGPNFIESGVLFYDKLLQRNQALRELMGSEGERKYTKLGNENFTLRQPRLHLTHRKKFFEQKLNDTNSKNDEDLFE